jgi:Ser/Thr protein kinase RdoA (MazF antagonist)
MTDKLIQAAEHAAAQMALEGESREIIPFGNGHICDTYAITFKQGDCTQRVVLQRINRGVFRQPEQLMQNISQVTAHLRRKIALEGGDPTRETLTLIPMKDGKNWYLDPDGEYWRAYQMIERVITPEPPGNPALFFESGAAFGRFQNWLSDFPAEQLYDTIPDFHNTPARFRAFYDAYSSDPHQRARYVKEEADFLIAREKDAWHLYHQLQKGLLPLRVTHNDTKLNNVLIDADTLCGLCVIDLDTVMPGLMAYDFGDAIRYGANSAAEDETVLAKVSLDTTMYKSFTQGYLAACGGRLTQDEIDSLPWGARIMTLECGMRFLTDYLLGDVYFKIDKPQHNLDRCRNQFRLLQDMEEKWDAMCVIVDQCRL